MLCHAGVAVIDRWTSNDQRSTLHLFSQKVPTGIVIIPPPADRFLKVDEAQSASSISQSPRVKRTEILTLRMRACVDLAPASAIDLIRREHPSLLCAHVLNTLQLLLYQPIPSHLSKSLPPTHSRRIRACPWIHGHAHDRCEHGLK